MLFICELDFLLPKVVTTRSWALLPEVKSAIEQALSLGHSFAVISQYRENDMTLEEFKDRARAFLEEADLSEALHFFTKGLEKNYLPYIEQACAHFNICESEAVAIATSKEFAQCALDNDISIETNLQDALDFGPLGPQDAKVATAKLRYGSIVFVPLYKGTVEEYAFKSLKQKMSIANLLEDNLFEKDSAYALFHEKYHQVTNQIDKNI